MITRREFLGFAGVAITASAAEAQVSTNVETTRRAALDAAVRKAVGGAVIRRGKVKLDVPPLIDNGNSVPISVTVDSPMTPGDHVKAIHVFTERNPQPYVISAYLGPRAGRALLATRCRIADTGAVVAVAQLSDGSFWSESANVVVTLSACLEEGLI